MPCGPFVTLLAEEVVAVAGDLRQDLAEAERDDGKVVAAQAQGRQADEHADQRRSKIPAASRSSHGVMWMPPSVRSTSMEPKCQKRFALPSAF